jgi:hypothetical protein
VTEYIDVREKWPGEEDKEEIITRSISQLKAGVMNSE